MMPRLSTMEIIDPIIFDQLIREYGLRVFPLRKVCFVGRIGFSLIKKVLAIESFHAS